MRPVRIFEAVALVLLGVGLDRLWLRPEEPPTGAPAASAAKREGSRDTLQSSAAVPVHGKQLVRESGGSANHESALRHADRRAEYRVEHPRNAKPILSPELEAKLLELAQSPIPRAVRPGETVNADGSVDLYGVSEDGKKFYRHFNPRGEITKEGWSDDPGGEDLHRTYYPTGQLKAMHWNRKDTSKTSIGFTLAGLYEYRWDKLPDGTEISTDFDDAGGLKGVWRKPPGGTAVRD